MHRDPETLTLRQALAFLRRRGVLVILCAAVTAAGAWLVAEREAKSYKATSAVEFLDSSVSQQLAGLPPAATSASALAAQRSTDLQLVGSGETAAAVAARIGGGLTAGSVARSVSVAEDGVSGESGIVGISATAGSRVLSAEIANAYAEEFVAARQAANRAYFRSALGLLERQLALLPRQQRASNAALQLQSRLQTLRLLQQLGYGDVKRAGRAFPPSSPASPNVRRDALLGLVVGLLGGFGLALLAETLDRRVVAAGELATLYRAPLLGAVPHSRWLAGNGKRGDEPAPSRDLEALQLIRARIRALHAERGIRSLAIVSPARSDGRTTLARNLAEAAARAGGRVLLVDADLRDPALAARLGIAASTGLAEVLTGETAAGDCVQPASVARRSIEPAPSITLDVLPAGRVPTGEPGALIERGSFDALLSWATSAYDLVVLDCAPLAVADSLPLLAKVDGVVAVARIGKSRREAAEGLRELLDQVGSVLLGVVANDVRSRGRAWSRDAQLALPQMPIERDDSTAADSVFEGVRA